jgi:hypothetical protein
MRRVVENLGQKSLLEYAVFRPWELASLVNSVLLSDVTGSSRDTSDTYVEYLNYLVSSADASPSFYLHDFRYPAWRAIPWIEATKTT